jgi:hypothetical protein
LEGPKEVLAVVHSGVVYLRPQEFVSGEQDVVKDRLKSQEGALESWHV